MGYVLAFANRKGGVGKTTLTVAIAHALTAEHGKSVCVVDTDPQASATLALAGEREFVQFQRLGIDKLLQDGQLSSRRPDIDRYIWGHVSHLTNRPDVPLSLIACSPQLWKLEDRLHAGKVLQPSPKRTISLRFQKLLKVLRERFDYVLIDTPPGRTFLSDHVTKEADLILVPSNTNPVAIWGLDIYEHELIKLRALERARWIWTLMNTQSNWQAPLQAFLSKTKVRAISRTVSRVGDTDLENQLIFPKLAKIEFALSDVRPKSFVAFYGQRESQMISEIATYLMREVESSKHEH
jgi:cellulose biosynthesis protein BcsQ